MKVLILFFAFSTWAEDPRLSKEDVRECVEVAKGFMKSSEYSGTDNEQDLIGACRDVEASCVREAGESLRPTESLESKQFLGIVRACRGKGMGSCLRAQKDRVASFDRRELEQIKKLLKKCM